MPPYAVIIPTLNRYDLLLPCLAAARQSNPPPVEVFVIDNGGACPPVEARVVRPLRNLGVAASWNVGIGLATGVRPVILNDDMVVGPEVCPALASSVAGVATLRGAGFAAFGIDPECYRRVGPFDETFYPAYCEDADYQWRLYTAGYGIEDVPGHFQHGRSRTVAAMSAADRDDLQRRVDANLEYYARKWGGRPGGERFSVAFGGTVTSVEQIRGAEFARRCWTPSDINEHLLTLHTLAQGCDRVTELGCGPGNSTLAFLHAQPARLTSYDDRLDPTVERLRALAGRTTFLPIRADTRCVAVGETDLLFIDSHHTEEGCAAQLAAVDNVRRHIVFHDAVTYGEHGDAGGRGILYAIRAFLASHPEWSVTRQDDFNHGLLVLTRCSPGSNTRH